MLHLKAVGAYAGESLHSFRRGMAQHLAAQGQANTTIMQTMMLQTQQILENKYLPAASLHWCVTALVSSVCMAAHEAKSYASWDTGSCADFRYCDI